MQFIDDADFQLTIDLDQGARISSLLWRDMQITVPFRGTVHNYGWYALAPWAGRVKDGILLDSKGTQVQLPTNLDPPHALHGFGFTSSWQEIGPGRALLHLPAPYKGATVEQRIEVLDDAIRWSLEYDDNGCDLPFWLGLHPWFARELPRGGSAELEFSAQTMLKRGSDGIPTGERISPTADPWDDAFTDVRGTPAIVWEDVLRVSIESDAPWWVVYTEDQEGICVEPQTAPPDAANLGISGENYIEALFVFEEI